MEEAGLAKRYYTNFVLDEGKLRKVSAVLHDFGKRISDDAFVRLYVERENDSYWETRSVDDVLADDNPPGRAIRILTLSLLTAEGKSVLAKVSFGRDSELRAAVTITHTDRDWCFLLGDEIDAQIQRALRKRPLRLLATRAADFVVVGSFFLAALAWLIAYAWRQPLEFTAGQIQQMTVDQRTRALLTLAVRRRAAELWYPVSVVLVPSLFFLLSEARPVSRLTRLLDRPVFYWGDSAAVYDRQRTRLSWILWSVGVAFIVSVLASLFAAWLLATGRGA